MYRCSGFGKPCINVIVLIICISFILSNSYRFSGVFNDGESRWGQMHNNPFSLCSSYLLDRQIVSEAQKEEQHMNKNPGKPNSLLH